MHGHQRKVVLRRDHTIGGTRTGKPLQPGNVQIRPGQMQAHQPGERHSNEDGYQSQPEILLPDHLVVNTENVLTDECLRWGVLFDRLRHVVHVASSRSSQFR